jgi:hypothetical protein
VASFPGRDDHLLTGRDHRTFGGGYVQPRLIGRRRGVKDATVFLVVFMSLFSLVGCHPLGDCSTPVTVTENAQYRITITEELPQDAESPLPPFMFRLAVEDTFVVVGAKPAASDDGCFIGQLDPTVLSTQFPELENCVNRIGGGIDCNLMPPSGCGSDLQLWFLGGFPINGSTGLAEISVVIQGSDCKGGSGRNKYTATATLIGFKTSDDAGLGG